VIVEKCRLQVVTQGKVFAGVINRVIMKAVQNLDYSLVTAYAVVASLTNALAFSAFGIVAPGATSSGGAM